MLFAAAARIVDLQVHTIADFREELGVEKRAVVGKLRQLVAVAKTPRFVADGKRQRQHFSGSERLFEGVDRIQISRFPADEMKRPVELNLGHRLMPIRQMNLRDRLRALVLKRKPPRAVDGTAFGINIDGRLDRRYFRLRKILVLLESPLVVGEEMTAIGRGQILIEYMRVVVVPNAGTHGEKQE